MNGARPTIYALSSAPGRAGVAVVRLSGTQAVEILEKITKRPAPPERKMMVRKIRSGDELIDEALVVWFDAGRSFTMEEMVELHLHGGKATVSGVLRLLAGFSDLQPADPGEFTRRAMESGRLDLVEVEALADLINAETEEQRKQALSLMIGDGHDKAIEWRDMFLLALALLEAAIDFADEEDAPDDVTVQVDGILANLQVELQAAIDGSRAAARVRDGFRIALVGAPNSGKSTLINALAKRQAAITSPFAGTTRDVIEVACDFDGYPVVLQDMAGLREASDPVEKIGVARAKETAATADLRIFLYSPDAPLDDTYGLEQFGDLQLQSKCDLYEPSVDDAISAVTGEGLEMLIARIVHAIALESGTSGVFARERQIECLRTAREAVDDCIELAAPELKVEHLRSGVAAMNHLFGDIGTEEILGKIFSQFCIGK